MLLLNLGVVFCLFEFEALLCSFKKLFIITWKAGGSPARTGSHSGGGFCRTGVRPVPFRPVSSLHHGKCGKRNGADSGSHLLAARGQGGKKVGATRPAKAPRGRRGQLGRDRDTPHPPTPRCRGLPLGQPISCLSGCGSRAGPSPDQAGTAPGNAGAEVGVRALQLSYPQFLLLPVPEELIPLGRGSPRGSGLGPAAGSPAGSRSPCGAENRHRGRCRTLISAGGCEE